jgi:hypothetical protein
MPSKSSASSHYRESIVSRILAGSVGALGNGGDDRVRASDRPTAASPVSTPPYVSRLSAPARTSPPPGSRPGWHVDQSAGLRSRNPLSRLNRQKARR